MIAVAKELRRIGDEANVVLNDAADEIDRLADRCVELEYALNQIASLPRPDGTYNLSREACEQIARAALYG